MAVPASSRTEAMAQRSTVSLVAISARATAWSSMPPVMRCLRPHRSDNAAVASCPSPQTAGYRATRVPVCPRVSPAEVKRTGNRAPSEAVVEVVDQACLAGRGEGGLAEAGLGEHLPVGQFSQVGVNGGLMGGVGAGLVYGDCGEAEAEGAVGDPEQERLGVVVRRVRRCFL
jgi:hypothetical protein